MITITITLYFLYILYINKDMRTDIWEELRIDAYNVIGKAFILDSITIWLTYYLIK